MAQVIIRDNSLIVGDKVYPSAAWSQMLAVFGVAELPVASPLIEPDSDGGENFTISGNVTIFSQPVQGAQLYLDFASNGEFEFQFEGILPSLSLSTLPGQIMPISAQSGISQLGAIEFQGVKLIFDSEEKDLYFGLLSSASRLDIFEPIGLSLENIGFELLRSYGNNTASLFIHAAVKLGTTVINTQIEVPLATDLGPGFWVLGIDSTIPLSSGLQDMIAFLDGTAIGQSLDLSSFAAIFPSNVREIPTFFLDDIQVLIDPLQARIHFITFRARSVRPIKIAGDSFSVNSVGVRMSVNPNAGISGLSLTIFGSVQVKDEVFLNISVLLPEDFNRNDWVFFSSGRIDLQNIADLDGLPINTASRDLKLPQGFFKLESVALNLFEVYFNPVQQTVSSIVLDLAVNAECELIHDLRFKNPKLSLYIVNPFNNGALGNKSVTGLIAGTIAVGEINFGVSAEKRDAGWSFTGATETKSILIGEMIISVGRQFGVTMPDFLHGVDLEDLTLRFETDSDDQDHKSSSVRFDCKGGFPIDDKKAEISLAVDVTKNGSYTIDLSGELKISTLDFKTIYSKESSDNFFAAVYSHTKEQSSVKLKDIVGSVSSEVAGYVPDGLEVDLKYVLLVFDKNNSGSKFLFGMDLGASARLSDLVSNLPLVGKMLPPNQTIGIDDVQILIASEQFDETLGAEVAGILPGESANDAGRTMLKNGLDKGLNVSATLRFGETRRPLDLPISGGTDKNPAISSPSASVNTPDVTSSDNVKWFALQKAFGPVHFNRLGVQYKDSELYILLDASITVAGLTLSMDGLSVSSPLNKFAPTFHLRGIGIDYEQGDSFEIAGAFLRREIEKNGTKYEEYDGAALIKIKQFALSAIGSYAYYDGHPSLFIFSVLDYPIGGPTFFFVTGLAAGFGYNRSLAPPAIDQVAKFPLVARAIKGPSATQKLDRNALDSALQEISQYIPPSVGDVFLAIGVRFNSFKIVDSFALLTVSFGTHFEINLLGLSNLVAPANAGAGVPPVAEAQLALKGTFQPDNGFLGVQAQLTSNSYLLSKACRLTGGFAFYSWFAGSEHDGDFVLTLGGYHPHFKVPDHYPAVPRLGFDWEVSPELSLKGDAYFALTASALMAGGHLEANWRSGSVHAWFKFGADFLIAWQPYHYEISVYVNMGVEVTFEFFGTQHISIDVGADLNIWGPEFSGEANIHLSIVSFKVEFGAAASRDPKPIDWPEFTKSFLPADKGAVCSVAVTGGLIDKGSQGDPQDANSQDARDYLGVINPRDFSLVTNSLIPSTAAQEAKDQPIDLSRWSPGKIGIGSMGIASGKLTSTHTVTISRKAANGKTEFAGGDFSYTPVFKKVPAALWGESLTPDLNGKQFIENALSGFEIRPRKLEVGETASIERSKLQAGDLSMAGEYAWENVKPFAAASFGSEDKRREELEKALPKGAAGRNTILNALGFAPEDLNKIVLSASLADDFLVAPQIEQN